MTKARLLHQIAEVCELFIGGSGSWKIGELVADGWKMLGEYQVGYQGYDYKRHTDSICVLGRPADIMARQMNSPTVCCSLILSGRRSQEIKLGDLCSVPNCGNQAEFEVIFYDYYDYMNHVQFATDFTCPFICEQHMLENEARAHGERRPRSEIHYPYSKGQGGQAYTKYLPASFVTLDQFGA